MFWILVFEAWKTKIWVRADYIRMFNFAKEFYAETLSNPLLLSPCLITTGQPGIGEFC